MYGWARLVVARYYLDFTREIENAPFLQICRPSASRFRVVIATSKCMINARDVNSLSEELNMSF